MTIEEFKLQLMKVIYRYLRHKYNQELFTILLGANKALSYVSLRENNGQVLWETKDNANPAPSNIKHQPILSGLLQLIMAEEQGYALHRSLQHFLKDNYPTGLFFSSRMPLFEALRKTLKKFTLNELNHSDVTSLKQKLEGLLLRIEQLIIELKAALARCKELTETNHNYQQRIKELEEIVAERDSLRDQLVLAQQEAKTLLTRLEDEERKGLQLQTQVEGQVLRVSELTNAMEGLSNESEKLVEVIAQQTTVTEPQTSEPQNTVSLLSKARLKLFSNATVPGRSNCNSNRTKGLSSYSQNQPTSR